MIRGSLGFAGYRIRTTLGQRWSGYLSLVVLVGLLGGLGMGSLAGLSDTWSPFSTFVASALATGP